MRHIRNVCISAISRQIIVACVIIILLLCGCKSRCGYGFGQSVDNIESIQVIYLSPYDAAPILEQIRNAAVVAEIGASQWDSFLYDFQQIPCSTQYFDPLWGLSGYVVWIDYKDDTFELICDSNGAYFDGFTWQYQSHIINETLFKDLLDKTTTGTRGQGDGSPVSQNE